MPTIEQNKATWNDDHNWKYGGEEWSACWGGSYMQWHGTILPRILAFLPARSILEIAPGFGRWTEYLKDYSTNLSVVDISEKCINACRQRFAASSHMSYFVNDGKSLDMIPDDSVDLVFSFDSLVHVEDTIISAYIAQLSRKIKQNGAIFIHHSNLGEYTAQLRIQQVIGKAPGLFSFLKKAGIFDELITHWRDPSMTAIKMQQYAKDNGLQCISQELVNWGSKSALIDCLSMIVHKKSIYYKENTVFRNTGFMQEAERLSILSKVIALRSNI
ncbi:MAG: class I SAM-dependent methyltransferase [Candidatus Margulisiibacteriota bacterium]|jgi:SAM-dependent methyltransferase